jgi:hypothetical protein
LKKVHEKLRDMMTGEDGAIYWAKQHNSSFKYNKLTLIDFAHSSKAATFKKKVQSGQCTSGEE